MLPHITNSQAGRNKYEVLYKNIFEVQFTLPEALRTAFGQDEAILSEHVLSVEGLSALDKAPEANVQQKFMGTTRTYLASGIDDTSAEITVKFSLNLRNGTDNFIYKLFKAWGKLGYDIATGEKSLKTDYTADFMRIVVGNRAGDIYREVIFKDVMLNGPVEGMGDNLDYGTSNEVMELTVKFKTDWWQEINR